MKRHPWWSRLGHNELDGIRALTSSNENEGEMLNDIIWWAVDIIVGTGVVLCLIMAIIILYRGWAFLQVSTVVNRNSDETAENNFLTLLQEAKESMVVHDDGNKMEGSIYQSRRVIDAVRGKLSENPRFRLSCCFNFNDDMLFTKELEGHPGVRIVIGHGERPDDDVHYKIIDEGIKAHISRHEVASQERRYRVIDCTRVPRHRRAHVADVLLEPYKAHALDVGIW